MRIDLQVFVRATRARFGEPRSDWRAIFSRPLSSEDWVDAAAIGGASVIDILAGRVTDADLEPQVVDAFHAQYPRVTGSFVDFVRDHADAEQLRGIISGVKGKVFELAYVDYLNDGHLPAGHVAEVAASATQPGWDIAIKDAGGNVVDAIQAKATNSVAYIQHAIERYPGIDVVTTDEAFDAIHDPSVHAHLLDGEIANHALETKVQTAIDLAGDGLDYHLPVLAFALIALQGVRSVASGHSDLQTAIRRMAERAGKTLAAGFVGWLSQIVTGEPIVGIPAAIGSRIVMGRFQITKDDTAAHLVSLARIHAITETFNARIGSVVPLALRLKPPSRALG